ncbi:MAG TPA: hypothetical protein VKZ54_00630, partial [Membranihabitans sp.]|nr:hypothetical protein [Membranihabitans sp.]
WADNSLYAIGHLYLDKLDEPEKALATFEKIFMDFDNSTFAVDARKKYRDLKSILQGDTSIQMPESDSTQNQLNDSLFSPSLDQN